MFGQASLLHAGSLSPSVASAPATGTRSAFLPRSILIAACACYGVTFSHRYADTGRPGAHLVVLRKGRVLRSRGWTMRGRRVDEAGRVPHDFLVGARAGVVVGLLEETDEGEDRERAGRVRRG